MRYDKFLIHDILFITDVLNNKNIINTQRGCYEYGSIFLISLKILLKLNLW